MLPHFATFHTHIFMSCKEFALPFAFSFYLHKLNKDGPFVSSHTGLAETTTKEVLMGMTFIEQMCPTSGLNSVTWYELDIPLSFRLLLTLKTLRTLLFSWISLFFFFWILINYNINRQIWRAEMQLVFLGNANIPEFIDN